MWAAAAANEQAVAMREWATDRMKRIQTHTLERAIAQFVGKTCAITAPSDRALVSDVLFACVLCLVLFICSTITKCVCGMFKKLQIHQSHYDFRRVTMMRMHSVVIHTPIRRFEVLHTYRNRTLFFLTTSHDVYAFVLMPCAVHTHFDSTRFDCTCTLIG